MNIKNAFKFIIVLLLTLITITFLKKEVSAHDTSLGIDDGEEHTYDPCQPYGYYPSPYTHTEGETWYVLCMYSDVHSRYEVHHIDNDIYNIYYKVNDIGLDGTTYGGSPRITNEYLRFIHKSIDDWNKIEFYKKRDDGTYYLVKPFNLIDVDTLDDPTSVEVNINIYPEGVRRGSIGHVAPVYDSIVEEDTNLVYGIAEKVFNTVQPIYHIHYTKYNIFLHTNEINNEEEIQHATAHELGHVFGLADIDVVEFEIDHDIHHQELLMGYCRAGQGMTYEPTLNDAMGMAIARGSHTDNDHEWMLDLSYTENNKHKLICSICNMVRYTSDLDNYSYVLYKSCDAYGDGGGHLPTTDNIMTIARTGDYDFWKCKYCKFTGSSAFPIEQKYQYVGEYTPTYHIVENHVSNLNYKLEEPHTYTITLADGRKKCKHCPYCDDGSIYANEDVSLNVNCVMNDYNDNASLTQDGSKLYKLDVDCCGRYNLCASSTSKVIIELFDSSMKKLDTHIVSSNDGNNKTITRTLYEGSYYVRVRYEDFSDSGDILLNINSCGRYSEPIEFNTVYNANEHVHGGIAAYHIETSIKRMLDILVTTSNGLYPSGMVTIKNSSGEVIDRFTNSEYDTSACTNEGQNRLIAYLNQTDKYTVEVTIPEGVDVTIKFCYKTGLIYNEFESEMLEVANDATPLNDRMYAFQTKQNLNLHFYVRLDSSMCPNMFVYVIEQSTTDYNNPYVLKYSSILNDADNVYEIDKNFDADKYYLIGFFGCNSTGNLDFIITSNITTRGESFVTDPDELTLCGTEVRLNGGDYRGNTITQGFTRLCYLLNCPSNSRLDYDWYSSNEEELIVTDFGTVLNICNYSTYGRIMAVYKYDRTKVYTKEFRMLREQIGNLVLYENNLSMNLYQVYDILPAENWPTGYVSNFTWTTTDPSVATVTMWGKVVAQGVGVAILCGTYKYNDRFLVYYYIDVHNEF